MVRRVVFGAAFAALTVLAIMLVPRFLHPATQGLAHYSYGHGGGMLGDYKSVDVRRADDGKALVTFSESEWYAQEPKVEEYLVSDAILADLEGIFNNYGMAAWHQREFSNMHVDDGPTTSYHFSFEDEDADDVWFSSQIFPSSYSDKLAELDEVIDKYVQSAEKLPGLVLKERANIDDYEPFKEGIVELRVAEYSENRVRYLISNGTEEVITVSDEYRLTKKGSSKAIADSGKEHVYETDVYPMSLEEDCFTLKTRLETGTYLLQVGNLTCSFEIA